MGSNVYRKFLKLYSSLISLLMISMLLSSAALGQSWNNDKNSISGLLQGVEINQDITKSAVLNKVISVKMGSATVLEALEKVADQADLELIYNALDLESVSHRLTLNVEEMTVNQALWTILEDTGFRFAVSSHGQLVIMKSHDQDRMEKQRVEDYLQVTVTGQVVDNQTGEALPGVNVIVAGSEEETGSIIGTQTDLDGNYSISVPDALNTLAFTYIGYQRLEVDVDGRSEIDVQLQQDIQMLDDVVVVGYGVQQEVTITGSVSSVDQSEISSIPTGDIASRLQGRVSGARITQNHGPSGGSVVRIRGIGTIGNNNPLYVVDGVPVNDISGLDPNNIRSISILKDAGSSAIYGSRAANGVVVIATERGEFNSPLQVSFNARYGMQQVANQLDLLNVQELGEKKWQELRNDGISPGDAGWGDLQYGYGSEPVIPDYIFPAGASEGDPRTDESLYNFGDPYYGITRANRKGTDWLDEIFHISPVQEYSLQISGGSAATRYSITGSYLNNQGILIHSGYERDRKSTRLNSSHV